MVRFTAQAQPCPMHCVVRNHASTAADWLHVLACIWHGSYMGGHPPIKSADLRQGLTRASRENRAGSSNAPNHILSSPSLRSPGKGPWHDHALSLTSFVNLPCRGHPIIAQLCTQEAVGCNDYLATVEVVHDNVSGYLLACKGGWLFLRKSIFRYVPP